MGRKASIAVLIAILLAAGIAVAWRRRRASLSRQAGDGGLPTQPVRLEGTVTLVGDTKEVFPCVRFFFVDDQGCVEHDAGSCCDDSSKPEYRSGAWLEVHGNERKSERVWPFAIRDLRAGHLLITATSLRDSPHASVVWVYGRPVVSRWIEIRTGINPSPVDLSLEIDPDSNGRGTIEIEAPAGRDVREVTLLPLDGVDPSYPWLESVSDWWHTHSALPEHNCRREGLTLCDLAPGPYRVICIFSRTDVEVRAGRSATAKLPSAARIAGTIAAVGGSTDASFEVDCFGFTAKGERIWGGKVVHPGSSFQCWTKGALGMIMTSGSDGFSLERAPHGFILLRLAFTPPGSRSDDWHHPMAWKWVEVKSDGDDLSVKMELDLTHDSNRLGAIEVQAPSGQVLDIGGYLPIEGVDTGSASFKKLSAPQGLLDVGLRTVLENGGRATFEAVPPGKYRLFAWDSVFNVNHEPDRFNVEADVEVKPGEKSQAIFAPARATK